MLCSYINISGALPWECNIAGGALLKGFINAGSGLQWEFVNPALLRGCITAGGALLWGTLMQVCSALGVHNHRCSVGGVHFYS